MQSPTRSPLRDEEQADAEERRQSSDKKKGVSCFHNPMLDKETLLEVLPNLAMATLLGVTAINVLTSNQSLSGGTTENKGLKQFLLAKPYTLFLLALLGLATAVSVKRRPRVLGCATGIMLTQLLLLVLMGGIVTLVRGEVDPWIVWPVTSGIIALVLLVWSFLCAYPKCLRWLIFYCCHSKEKEKVDPRTNSEKCDACGGITVGGKSSDPAGEGVQPCEKCGGAGARGGGTRRTPPGTASV